MREVSVEQVTTTIVGLCMEANYFLGDDMLTALEKTVAMEESPTGRTILEQLQENATIAATDRVSILSGYRIGGHFFGIGAGSAYHRW